MGILKNTREKLARLIAGYDAATSSKQRRTWTINRRTEDDVLKSHDREKIISASRDLRRNYSIAAWAVRKHLDYVSTYDFQCRVNDPANTAEQQLATQIEKLMDRWSSPQNVDVTGRHGLHQLIRLVEGLATTDGDSFVLKLPDGHIQIIEGDRIRNPSDGTTEWKYRDANGNEVVETIDWAKWTHGVDLSPEGRARRFAICARNSLGTTYELKTIVPAEWMEHHGYFDRYDQVRGISPLTAAINDFTDLYQAKGYALAKMKLAQLFGVKVTRGGVVDTDAEQTAYEFDFNSGPALFDLDTGDDVEFIESQTPSIEFQQFMQTGIQIGLKALDIPFSFYAENFTNYSGSRQALLQYEQSAQQKRLRLQNVLNSLTRWRIGIWIANGELTLPKGMTVDDIQFEWVPIGLPWVDPVKEVTADVMAITNRLDSRENVCRRSGKDYYSIVDQLAAEEAYAAAKGVSLPDVQAAIDQVAQAANQIAQDQHQQQGN